jgi:hypothetical protein
MRFEVLMAVKMMMMLMFWVVTPCGLAGGYKRFEETSIRRLSRLNMEAIRSS